MIHINITYLIAGQRFESNSDIIAATEDYFEDLDKSATKAMV